MDNSKKKFIRQILIIFIIYTLAITALAQENETRAAPQQGVEVIANKNTTFLEASQNYDEDVITEAQRNFDRSLDILNIVVSLLGVLVGLLTLIIAIVGGLGFFEIKKWHEARKNIDKDVEIIKDTRNKAEKELDMLRKEIEKNPISSLKEKPSEEIMKNLDEFTSRSELFEMLGVPLNSEDYFNRATDFYFKGKYELAIKAIEKAIELKPDYAEAWSNKGVALGKLGRHDEELKAYEKAIELKPDYVEAWYNKSVELGKLGRHDEALKACEKAIELKPDYAEAWNNKGVALCKLGRHDEALKADEKAIELKPDYAGALYNSACFFSIRDDKEKALSCLRRAIDIDITYKEKAKKDKDFKKLLLDESFKKLIE